MAFNFNFFKGSTTSQIQNALQYWATAFRPAEEIDKMKAEKEAELVEKASESGEKEVEPVVNAVILPVDEQVVEESPIEPEGFPTPFPDAALYE